MLSLRIGCAILIIILAASGRAAVAQKALPVDGPAPAAQVIPRQARPPTAGVEKPRASGSLPIFTRVPSSGSFEEPEVEKPPVSRIPTFVRVKPPSSGSFDLEGSDAPQSPPTKPPTSGGLPIDFAPRPAVPSVVAPVGRRVALVVGNASYRYMPSLTNPRNDAADVEKALTGLGFETILVTDLDRSGMNNAMERFSRLVPGASFAMIYYSGHGMQFEGKNYLLPVDASLESAADVNRYRLMPLDDLVDLLRSGSGLQLIVLDACRNNPIERDFKNKVASLPGGNRDAASTRGFARIDARNGLIITYATAPNSVASDGNGRNSPFTQAFLKNVAAPDVDVRLMLFQVQNDVYTASEAKQLPEISSLYVGPPVRLKMTSK